MSSVKSPIARMELALIFLSDSMREFMQTPRTMVSCLLSPSRKLVTAEMIPEASLSLAATMGLSRLEDLRVSVKHFKTAIHILEITHLLSYHKYIFL